MQLACCPLLQQCPMGSVGCFRCFYRRQHRSKRTEVGRADRTGRAGGAVAIQRALHGCAAGRLGTVNILNSITWLLFVRRIPWRQWACARHFASDVGVVRPLECLSTSIDFLRPRSSSAPATPRLRQRRGTLRASYSGGRRLVACSRLRTLHEGEWRSVFEAAGVH